MKEHTRSRFGSEEDSSDEDSGDSDTSKDIGKYAENCKIDFNLWQVKSDTIPYTGNRNGKTYGALEDATVYGDQEGTTNKATKEFRPKYNALEHNTITQAINEFGPEYSALEYSTTTQATKEFGPEYSALEHSTTAQATKEFDPEYSAPENDALTPAIADGNLIVTRFKSLGTHGIVRETCDEITTFMTDLVTREKDVSNLAQHFATEVRTWDPSISDTSENHLSPSLSPGGESPAAEGGANLHVAQLPSTCNTSTQTNTCFACAPTDPSKAANLTMILSTNLSTILKENLKKATTLLIIKTWGNPRGNPVKPSVPVLPLMSEF